MSQTNFGYMSESKLEFLKNPAMFWRPPEVSGFFMATFVYFSPKNSFVCPFLLARCEISPKKTRKLTRVFF